MAFHPYDTKTNIGDIRAALRNCIYKPKSEIKSYKRKQKSVTESVIEKSQTAKKARN